MSAARCRWFACPWLAMIAWSAIVMPRCASAAEVEVIAEPDASPTVRIAAGELRGVLHQLYPDAHGKKVRLLTSLPEPEAFSITATDDQATITGGGPRGAVHGIYALLEKLGCGFYLSGDVVPKARKEPLSFKDCETSNQPLVADRLVFNWHNFLSGCSTWDLPEWQRWIAQSQKMGFNAVMIHAYGNNPMVSFTFNGKTKPVGYLSTTVQGRDWSTMHVNDVRRIWGGDVFNAPVFGAEAAQGPVQERAGDARKLMQSVFASAAERSMNVFFANDVDTISANPQELIATLPAEARFSTTVGGSKFWLADPDTAEGYPFYKEQVAKLLADYPQITTLVVWFRNGGTPWMDLKASELPPAWQEQYNAIVARKSEAAKLWHSPSVFAIARIVGAYRRALKDSGHENVRLAAGTWNFDFLPAADLFLPPSVTVIGLDYGVLHDKSQLATRHAQENITQQCSFAQKLTGRLNGGSCLRRNCFYQADLVVAPLSRSRHRYR